MSELTIKGSTLYDYKIKINFEWTVTWSILI